VIQGLWDAHAIRYVSAAGFVILVYDHLLTIIDEVQYVWKAPPSIEKRIYLFNRYAIIILMLVNANEMCGFSGVAYTSNQCRILLVVTASCAVASAIMTNALILRRVLHLWPDNRAMKIFLSSMHIASSCVSISLAALTYVTAWKTVQWLPYYTNMCVATPTPVYAAFTGAPMFFELSMIISVIYKSMATPRSTSLPFVRALQNNGLLFFLSIICLRLVNVIISSTGRRSLALLWIYFTWVSTTTFFSRSVLRLRKAEIKARLTLTPEQFYMNVYHHDPPSVIPGRPLPYVTIDHFESGY